MSRAKHVLVVVPTGVAVVLLTAAFATEPPARPEPAAAARPLEPAAEAFGPATTVHAKLFSPDPAPPGRALSEADLAPLLEREPARRAKALFDAARYTDALLALPAEEAKLPPERFLRALLLLRAGRASEAAPAFLALAEEYPALSDRCRFLAATAFERAGDLSSAIGAFDAVEEGSRLYTEAQLALGSALRRLGDLRAAAVVYAPFAERPAPAWGWDVGADALFELGSIQEALGQRGQARESFLRLWSEHAASRHAAPALARARALWARPSAEQTILHAEGLMEAHRNQPAANLVAPLVESPPEGLSAAARCRAGYVLGKSYRKLRAHARAVAVLDAVVRECEAEEEIWSRSLYLAGTSATFVDPEAAIGYYRRLAHELPDSTLADDALFHVAELLARAGRTGQSRIALQRLIKLYPEGDTRAEGLFKLFWLERGLGRPERGLRALEQLAREYAATDPVSAERAMYWRGRTLVDCGRSAAGVAVWEQLVLRHPASFYALLARARLDERAPERAQRVAARLALPASLSPAPAIPLGALEGDRHLVAGVELLRLGLPELARDELLSIHRPTLREAESPEAIRALVTLLGRTGEVRLAHAIARHELRADLSGTLDAQTATVWRLAFPLAFRDLIERHAQANGVDPDLMQALIREESALDPLVRSWAGAIGLSQLMLPTAREVAGWLKIPGPITPQRLYDPDLNLQLGTTYLARLLQRFDGNLALSLASYNAGGGAVSRWIRNGGPRDLDEFIEEIPIAETRNYVKRVLKTYASYQYVYGRAADGATLDLAEIAAK